MSDDTVDGKLRKRPVEGTVAHDSVDADPPVKKGYKTTDYEPDGSDEPSGNKGEVAAGDVSDGAANRFGEPVEGVNPYFVTLDNISTTYDDDPTTATSTAVECWNYRQATLSYELDESGTATDIQFFVEISLDGTNFTDLTNDALGALIESDTSIGTGIEESYTFPIACQKIKIRVETNGTDADNTFTVANAVLYLRN